MGKTQSQAFPKVERKHSTKKGSKRKKIWKDFLSLIWFVWQELSDSSRTFWVEPWNDWAAEQISCCEEKHHF